ncbi:MAG: phasin family protein [Stappiaceae bacterium]
MMVTGFEDIQKLSKENVELAMQSANAYNQGVQAIAAEVADYSKKSLENGSAAAEKMMGAKSLDKAVEAQSMFAKSAYEGFVAEANKIGEMVMSMNKEVFKPIENVMGKMTK